MGPRGMGCQNKILNNAFKNKRKWMMKDLMSTTWTATTGEGKVTKEKRSPGGEHVSTRHLVCAVVGPTCLG